MKPSLTAIIIAKNEETRIAGCLKALAFAQEKIVVDNGSTDKTKEKAEKLGAIVIEAKEKDFAGIREFGLSKATGRWVLYIDADETVGEALRKEILHTIRVYKRGDPTSYVLRRNTFYLGFHWPYQDRVERLFLTSALKGWHGRLHETPVFVGESRVLNNPLLHTTHRTLEEMLKKTNDWSVIEAELRFSQHHPAVSWWRLIRVMVTGFLRSFIDQHGWRAGTIGWIESIYQAFSMFVTYAKLWEMQQKKSGR